MRFRQPERKNRNGCRKKVTTAAENRDILRTGKHVAVRKQYRYPIKIKKIAQRKDPSFVYLSQTRSLEFS